MRMNLTKQSDGLPEKSILSIIVMHIIYSAASLIIGLNDKLRPVVAHADEQRIGCRPTA